MTSYTCSILLRIQNEMKIHVCFLFNALHLAIIISQKKLECEIQFENEMIVIFLF
jgi:hypothetical protein